MDLYHLLTETLFKKGFGGDTRTVAQYRRGIEPIPEGLLADDSDLFLLSLADPRPGLLRSCKLLGIQHEELGHRKRDAIPFDNRFPIPGVPFWFCHDKGHHNRGRRPDHCRDELVGDIIAGSAIEGIFAYAHHPDIVVEGKHIIDLPRTVHRGFRVNCACLEVWERKPKLSLDGPSYNAYPFCGTLRVRRK